MFEHKSIKNSLMRLTASFTYHNEKWLEGQLLTIIDASIANERQNKHVKDLIKSAIDQYRCDKRSNLDNCFGEVELAIQSDLYQPSKEGFVGEEDRWDFLYINRMATNVKLATKKSGS